MSLALFAPLLALPTAAFTILCLLSALYWLLVVAGLADVDGHHGAAEGIDGVVGGAKAGGAALDGALGAAKGAGDITLATKGFTGWRVQGVPLTVSLSFFALGGLVSSLLLRDLFAPLLPAVAAQALAAVGATLAGLASARIFATPLRGVFAIRSGTRRQALLGQTATLSTGRVDGSFGQAALEDGGAGLLLPVRHDGPNGLQRGDRVLLVDFDPVRQAYVIEPLSAPPRATSARPLPEGKAP